MLYEGLKDNETIVIVPGTVVETMQPGSIAGLTSLTPGLGRKRASKEKAGEHRKTRMTSMNDCYLRSDWKTPKSCGKQLDYPKFRIRKAELVGSPAWA